MTSHAAIRFLASVSLIAASSSSRAQTTQNDLRALLAVRTVAELEQSSAATLRLSTIDSACSAELKAHALPRSCFMKLNLQKVVDSHERSRLSRICRESASKSQSRIDLADSRGLPDDCRIAVRSRLDDLQYADEDNHPEMAVNRIIGPVVE